MFEGLKQWAEQVVEDYGYIGIFIISFTEAIIQPIPPDPFITGGTAFGLIPVKAAIVATIGSVTGGLVAYILGKILGEPIFLKLFKQKWYEKGELLFRKYGIWAVIIAGVTPIPFKAICWLAGIFEMPILGFLIGAILGRLPRFLAVAYFGKFLSGL
ncbi:MAG: DedA family protein [Aquificae bacterium]|nr:DedA family protein [Aquificota bacterium]